MAQEALDNEIQGEKHKPRDSASPSTPLIPATLNDGQNYFPMGVKKERRGGKRNTQCAHDFFFFRVITIRGGNIRGLCRKEEAT